MSRPPAHPSHDGGPSVVNSTLRVPPGLFRQPKQTVKTKLRQGDLVNFTVDNIIQMLNKKGYGDTPEEKGKEALDSYFGVRQGHAKKMQHATTLRRFYKKRDTGRERADQHPTKSRSGKMSALRREHRWRSSPSGPAEVEGSEKACEVRGRSHQKGKGEGSGEGRGMEV